MSGGQSPKSEIELIIDFRMIVIKIKYYSVIQIGKLTVM